MIVSVSLALSLSQSVLPNVSFHLLHRTTVDTKPCSHTKNIFSSSLGPPCYACQHPLIIMRLETLHAAESVGQDGRGRKQIRCPQCVYCRGLGADFGAAVTSDLSCQSRFAQVCVIAADNTSTAARIDEQTQTHVYAYSHKETLNHTHAGPYVLENRHRRCGMTKDV